MKFPICSFSRFVLARKTHTHTAVFQSILPEAIGDQLQIVAPVSYLFLGLPESPQKW